MWAAVCGALFGVLTWMVVAGTGIVAVDDDVERVVVAHRVGWMTGTLKVATWLGSSLVLWPVVVVVSIVVVWSARRWKDALFLIVAMGGSVGLSDLVKAWVDRPRPPASVRLIEVSGAAYPSGHAMDALVALAALASVIGMGWSRGRRGLVFAAAGVITVAVGWSRIYLGEHWLTDVLGSYLLGATWVLVLAAALLTPPAAPARSEPYPPGRGP
jgi:undecaprenyl-diphosphatase